MDVLIGMNLDLDTDLKKEYEQICESLWPDIFKFIYYKVQDKQEAEDLTQDVFIKVSGFIASGEVNRNKVKGYIFSAARNTVFDFWRKKARQPATVGMDTAEQSPIMCSEERDLLYDDFERKENLKMVLDGLDSLSIEEKDLLILRVIDGRSIKEVARLTGKPQGTVKSRQYRALQKLRQYLLERSYYNE